ncbi:MAG TPA: hypothetical protein VF491_01550 [Vicinamibacterales bacterium]
MSDADDFYIGYEAGMPASMRRPVLLAVIVMLAAAGLAGAIFVTKQRSLAESRFDYGNEQSLDGYLSLAPIPALLVPEPSGVTTYWLVAPGKYGAAAIVDDGAEGWVTVSGKLIARESWRMLEVRPRSIRPRPDKRPMPLPSPRQSRVVSLRGEIVDGKCFLGVMNPGERTVHRDCAERCISGGVPPMFAYVDDAGSHLAMLIGADAEVLHGRIGYPITLSGVLGGAEEARVFDISRAQ